ncbi:Mariner Mos1 transposase like protein [Argiope bruennichi]|uniref:Mariner Mos1 transposase like protein n=1 Tax=Argiope bruennichi TaxID=94029 RepID=A0A8T0E9I5_ARGBR|nr:Mariner Mos1 transposase like protein [Argiope bruennichi]
MGDIHTLTLRRTKNTYSNFKKGRTINAVYYANLLDKLYSKIKEKRPGVDKKNVPFHQDKAPIHTPVIVMATLPELKFKILPRASYSPDMAPSDYGLFTNLKKYLAGRKFCSDIEVISAKNAYFEVIEESSYKEGVQALPHL